MKQLFFFNLKRVRQLIVPTAALIFLFIACDNTNDMKSKEHNPNAPVEAFSFQPDSGRIRDKFLINGSNFGNDPSLIKVLFNGTNEAIVLGAVDEQILVLVPRTAEGLVSVEVQVGNAAKAMLPGKFLYKSSRQVTTVAGMGAPPEGVEENTYTDGPYLDRARIRPVYIGADRDGNVFVTLTNDRLIRINEDENLIITLLTTEQGFTHRVTPNIHPETGWVLLGHESQRDRFFMLDPENAWSPTHCFIKNWDLGPVGRWDGPDQPLRTKFLEPQGNNLYHYNLLYCEHDGYFYTHYGPSPVGSISGTDFTTGHIVRIDPATWNAEVIGMVPPGTIYGMAFNTDPEKKWELWLAYSESHNGQVGHSLCTVNITDRQTWREKNPATNEEGTRPRHPLADSREESELGYSRIMSSFEKRSGDPKIPTNESGHRNGLLTQALFNGMRQVSFDRNGILYVGDNNNHCVRKVDVKAGVVTDYVGIPRVSIPFADGNERDATFRNLHGIVTVETANDYLIYASDYGNQRVRKIAEE